MPVYICLNYTLLCLFSRVMPATHQCPSEPGRGRVLQIEILGPTIKLSLPEFRVKSGLAGYEGSAITVPSHKSIGPKVLLRYAVRDAEHARDAPQTSNAFRLWVKRPLLVLGWYLVCDGVQFVGIFHTPSKPTMFKKEHLHKSTYSCVPYGCLSRP